MAQIKKIIAEFKIPIKEVLIAPNLVKDCFFLLNKINLENKKTLIVSDQNTYQIAGKNIFDSIVNNGNKHCQSLIMQSPKADEADVLKIINQAQNDNLIIAVGSGTINDLCKIASFRLQIPYIVFGTAPSMNGYASSNASITVGGRKTSFPAHLATAIYLDLNILIKAPTRLIKAGIGDSLCLSTCHFDWLLSHLILQTTYNQIPFDLLRENYQKLISFSATTDQNFIETLAKTLIISGFGMYICGGSYPASQAEHLIAHYIEIKYPKIAENSYHGEQIAVCTLSVADLQEKILQQKNLQIRPTNFNKNDLEEIFDKKLTEHFFDEINKKAINDDDTKKINQNLQDNWLNIKTKLQKAFISKDELLKCYRQFALPENCEEIGFEKPIYNQALTNSNLIRNRFTSLDLIKIII